jgi:hypothetical protein
MDSRKKKSTITACQSFTGNVQEAFAVGIFFDLTKLYNVINHDILLEN